MFETRGTQLAGCEVGLFQQAVVTTGHSLGFEHESLWFFFKARDLGLNVLLKCFIGFFSFADAMYGFFTCGFGVVSCMPRLEILFIVLHKIYTPLDCFF